MRKQLCPTDVDGFIGKHREDGELQESATQEEQAGSEADPEKDGQTMDTVPQEAHGSILPIFSASGDSDPLCAFVER